MGEMGKFNPLEKSETRDKANLAWETMRNMGVEGNLDEFLRYKETLEKLDQSISK